MVKHSSSKPEKFCQGRTVNLPEAILWAIYCQGVTTAVLQLLGETENDPKVSQIAPRKSPIAHDDHDVEISPFFIPQCGAPVYDSIQLVHITPITMFFLTQRTN